MLPIALALALSVLALDTTPASNFDHQAACEQIKAAAAQPDVQNGAVIDRTTKHGGVRVDCEHRIVQIQTLINRKVGKNWLVAQERNWLDDVCADPVIHAAVSNGWRVTQAIVVRGRLAVVFRATC